MNELLAEVDAIPHAASSCTRSEFRSIFGTEFGVKEYQMRDVDVSDGIVPLGEFKSKASKIIRDIAGSDEPVVITQNGRPAAVLMSPKAFQELRESHEFYRAVAEGVTDSEAGRVIDHKKVRRWLESWGTDREKGAPE